MDANNDQDISLDEFKEFFAQVMEQKKEDGSPLYTDEDVAETVDDLMSGEAWVDCARPPASVHHPLRAAAHALVPGAVLCSVLDSRST